MEDSAALLYDICDMPEELVVGLILLDCGPLRFLHFNVDRRRSEIQTDRHSLNLLKAKVTVLICLEFQGDHILRTLLGIEHVESKGQVGLILRAVVISDCIEACLCRETRFLIGRTNDLRFIPLLLVELWVRLKSEAFNRLERELGSGIVFLWVIDCDVNDTFHLELADLPISI